MLFACFASGESVVDAYSYDAAESLDSPEWAVWDEWELQSGVRIRTEKSQLNRQRISVDGMAGFILEESCFVSAVEMALDSKCIIFLVSEAVPRGSNNQHLIYVLAPPGEKDEVAEFGIAMSHDSIKGLEGYRHFVSKIGRVESFPYAMLLVAWREKPESPTKVIYEWQLWDIANNQLIRRYPNEFKGPHVKEPLVLSK